MYGSAPEITPARACVRRSLATEHDLAMSLLCSHLCQSLREQAVCQSLVRLLGSTATAGQLPKRKPPNAPVATRVYMRADLNGAGRQPNSISMQVCDWQLTAVEGLAIALLKHQAAVRRAQRCLGAPADP